MSQIQIIDEFPEKADWETECRKQILPEWLLRKHANKLHWENVSKYQNLSETFMNDYADFLHWNKLMKNKKISGFSEDFIERNIGKMSIEKLTTHFRVPDAIIEKHIEIFSSYYVSKYQKLSEKFIRNHAEWLNWEKMMMNHQISESLIREFEHMTTKENILKYTKISEEYIEKLLSDGGMLSNIKLLPNIKTSPDEKTSPNIKTSPDEKTSPKIIHTNYNCIDLWSIATEHQVLSQEFIEKHFDKLDKKKIMIYQNVSDEFIENHKNGFGELYEKRAKYAEKKMRRIRCSKILSLEMFM